MPTLQDSNLDGRLEEILNADRAILVHGILHANVRVADLVGIAAATGVTVEKVLATTHAADTTLRTMKNLLLDSIVVPEVTVWTEVGPQDGLAIDTLPARWLRKKAHLADHLFDARSVDLVGSHSDIFFLVVAMPAPKDVSAAWSHNATFSSVVSASCLAHRIYQGGSIPTRCCRRISISGISSAHVGRATAQGARLGDA